jgi:hypothetical protein
MAHEFAQRLQEDPLLARLQSMYLDGGIDGVALVAADDNPCHTCRSATDRSYLPSGLPPLPVPGCTAPDGCRCRYEPNVTVYE